MFLYHAYGILVFKALVFCQYAVTTGLKKDRLLTPKRNGVNLVDRATFFVGPVGTICR